MSETYDVDRQTIPPTHSSMVRHYRKNASHATVHNKKNCGASYGGASHKGEGHVEATPTMTQTLQPCTYTQQKTKSYKSSAVNAAA